MILAAFYHSILAIFFAVISVLLVVTILLQRGKGVGLAGAFGGAGGGAAFGAKTGDVLTWVTVVGAIVLLSYTVVLNFVFVEGTPDLEPTAEASAASGAAATEEGAGEQPAEESGGGAWLLDQKCPRHLAGARIFGEYVG